MRTFFLTILGMSFMLLGLGLLADSDLKLYQDLSGSYHIMWKADNLNDRIIQE